MAEPVEKLPDDTAQEEFVEETPKSSWDALDAEFDEADGANFVDEEKEVKEPAAADDVPPPEATKEEPEAEAEAPESEASKEPEQPTPVEEPAPVEAEKVEEPPKAEEPAQAAKQQPEPPPVEGPPPLTTEQRQELRSQALNELTKGYELGKEEAEDFELRPAEALPKLAANLHLKVYENVVNSVMRNIPQLLEGMLSAKETAKTREEAFYEEWPDLRGYEAQTMQMAQMWRQLNPTAPEDQARKEIGRVAMAALGLSSQTPASPAPAARPASTTPVPPTPPPVQSTQSSQRPTNPFEQLSREWENEEEFD